MLRIVMYLYCSIAWKYHSTPYDSSRVLTRNTHIKAAIWWNLGTTRIETPKHVSTTAVKIVMMASSSRTTLAISRGSSLTRAHSRRPYMGTPTRHMAESHCDTFWANVTSPYPSTDSTRVTYGIVTMLTSMLDAVNSMFITALNFTE